MWHDLSAISNVSGHICEIEQQFIIHLFSVFHNILSCMNRKREQRTNGGKYSSLQSCFLFDCMSGMVDYVERAGKWGTGTEGHEGDHDWDKDDDCRNVTPINEKQEMNPTAKEAGWRKRGSEMVMDDWGEKWRQWGVEWRKLVRNGLIERLQIWQVKERRQRAGCHRTSVWLCACASYSAQLNLTHSNTFWTEISRGEKCQYEPPVFFKIRNKDVQFSFCHTSVEKKISFGKMSKYSFIQVNSDSQMRVKKKDDLTCHVHSDEIVQEV